MKIKTIQQFAILLFLFGISGCVNDQDFSTPNINCEEPQLKATNTIAQIKELYGFGGPKIIENDLIIEGYVVSNDKAGNIYKSISIQDAPENPTSAIKISIDESSLYAKYNVGRKIYVKLKGLAVGYSYGSIQIGAMANGELGRISAFEINKYIIRSCEEVVMVPKKVHPSEFNKSMLEMLVEVENVQFKTTDLGASYGTIDNTETVNRILDCFDANCLLTGQLSIRNSGYSTFKNELVPNGKGSVIGVLSNFYDDFQLFIRDTDDVKLVEPRCDYSKSLTSTVSVLEIKELYKGSMVEFGVEKPLIIEGYVVSTDEYGNFEKRIVIQDAVKNPTAGLQLLLDSKTIFNNYKIGDKVYVRLNKLYMTKNEGVLTIGFPKGVKVVAIDENLIGNYIFNSGENSLITPVEIGISESQFEKFQNTLVKIRDVQLTASDVGKSFAYFSGVENGVRTIETCNIVTKLSVFTNGKSLFASRLFPNEHGTITGVLGSTLEVRNFEDVQFNEPYKVCEVIVPKIMITEVADPINNVSARFVELFNAGETAIKLTGWKLNKYMNGATTVASGAVDLSEIIIQPGGFAIIASTDYKTVFNAVPEIESTYISGNGDDVYEIVDNTGKRIDIYGVIGEDGNGTNWEYLDGRAFRNIDVLKPNSNFTIFEWTVFSDATNNLINHQNAPKNAPNDYNPNLR